MSDHETTTDRWELEHVFEHVPHAVSYFGPDLRLVFCNRRYIELLDFPEHMRARGTPLEDFFRYNAERGEYGPGDAEELVRQRMDDARNPRPHRFVRTRPDGTKLEVTGTPLADGGFVTVYADVTESERAKEALREKSLRLDEAQRMARIGSWELDLLQNRLTWTDEIFRIFEIDQQRFGASYEAFLAGIHPDDREAVNAAYVNSLETRRPYDIVHRLRMADGRIKHVHERCQSEFDAKGKPVRSVGTVQDITERVEAEERIRLYATVFEHSVEAIMITDRENRIVEVNDAFTRMTGYSLGDLYGQNPRVLASGHTPRETYPAMWAALAEQGFWQGELWDRRKDGSVYPKWVSISALRDAQGEVSHYAASFSDITERKAAEERIERLALQDSLTGLLNRFSLQERLQQALAAASRDNSELAVLFIDLDRFKLVNDTLGHQVGDGLLVAIAERLLACVRKSDIVGRVGGDEFVVVLTGVDSGLDAASHTAGKILERLGEPYRIDGHQLHSSPSIGVSVYPGDGADVQGLLKSADTAMYDAKAKGRNNVRFFTADMNRISSDRLHVEQELRAGLVGRQFVLHYQPQISGHDGIVCGVEALLRWRHPEKGMVPPERFIAIAEELGLIEQLGRWALDEACRQLAEWKADGVLPGKMAVNVSAHQLRSSRFVADVRAAMATHGIQAGELELEITESAALGEPERALAQLQALREVGVELAIDDFGTGYSSLTYLRLLPIQTVKLDRSFVGQIDTNPSDAAICAAALAMAHNLGIRVVAEGVERQEQRDFLAERHCDILQGYLFSRPLPADDVPRFIRGHRAGSA